jgi:hypothetical protein
VGWEKKLNKEGVEGSKFWVTNVWNHHSLHNHYSPYHTSKSMYPKLISWAGHMLSIWTEKSMLFGKLIRIDEKIESFIHYIMLSKKKGKNRYDPILRLIMTDTKPKINIIGYRQSNSNRYEKI